MPDIREAEAALPAVARSAFHVAQWFAERAWAGGRRLQPMALQQLLFLAQAWYAAAHAGRALMPAVFVADELGPVEPNVHAAFSCERPAFELERPLPAAAETVLDQVWARYGGSTGEQLMRLTAALPAVQAAASRGWRSPIAHADIARCLADEVAACERRPIGAEPRLLRNQDGRSVRVAAWRPEVRSAPSA